MCNQIYGIPYVCKIYINIDRPFKFLLTVQAIKYIKSKSLQIQYKQNKEIYKQNKTMNFTNIYMQFLNNFLNINLS